MPQLINIATTGTGDWINMSKSSHREFISFQVTSSDGLSTTIIEGRASSAHGALTLDTVTGSGGNTVAYYPEIRARVTALTGTVVADAVGN